MVAALKKEEMLNLAEDAVNLAVKKGAGEAESFIAQGVTTSAAVERGQIAKSSRIVDCGVGVRIVMNKALGFSYTNVLDDKTSVEATVLKALNSAKASRPDSSWSGFPAKKSFASAENTYDPEIVNLSAEDLVKLASEMIDAAQEKDKRAFPIEGGVGAAYSSCAVANSNGVAGFDRGTYVECSLATIATEGKEVTPVCFEFGAERKYEIDPDWVGGEAARLAVSALKAKRTETRRTSVIFTQFALQELLHFTLINAVKADYVQRNQSALKGKIGEKVASDIVNVHDDGLLSGGLRTASFDGEGVPQQKTVVVEKGVLRNFLYDNYAAKKEGKESTGNAVRMGYMSTPSLGATNFHILPGAKMPDQLVNEVDEGLIVYYLQGAHSSNPASGEFSVVATPAWAIKHGEIAYATKGAMIAGNIFDVLANVSDLANNERKIGQLIAPWMLVENVKVIGK